MKAKTKQAMKAAVKVAAAKTLAQGVKRSRELAVAADAALIKAGKAAQDRQRKRARATLLKKAGKVALAAGAATAAVMTVRAVARRNAEPNDAA